MKMPTGRIHLRHLVAPKILRRKGKWNPFDSVATDAAEVGQEWREKAERAGGG
jgi:hypothetical protein